jgi:hypothetical protein
VNRVAYYGQALKDRGNRVYGPFLTKEEAEAYAKERWGRKGKAWAVYPMTGRDIMLTKARVSTP